MKIQSVQVLKSVSAAYPAVLPPPWSLIASWGKLALQSVSHLGMFTLGLKLHGKRVTREHITCRRSSPPERLCRAPAVSLSLLHSYWLFCGVHTERWLSCIRGSATPNPLLRAALRPSTVCSFCWAVVIAWKTNKCRCLAGKLRGSPVWAGCLGSEGPWGLGFL